MFKNIKNSSNLFIIFTENDTKIILNELIKKHTKDDIYLFVKNENTFLYDKLLNNLNIFNEYCKSTIKLLFDMREKTYKEMPNYRSKHKHLILDNYLIENYDLQTIKNMLLLHKKYNLSLYIITKDINIPKFIYNISNYIIIDQNLFNLFIKNNEINNDDLSEYKDYYIMKI